MSSRRRPLVHRGTHRDKTPFYAWKPNAPRDEKHDYLRRAPGVDNRESRMKAMCLALQDKMRHGVAIEVPAAEAAAVAAVVAPQEEGFERGVAVRLPGLRRELIQHARPRYYQSVEEREQELKELYQWPRKTKKGRAIIGNALLRKIAEMAGVHYEDVRGRENFGDRRSYIWQDVLDSLLQDAEASVGSLQALLEELNNLPGARQRRVKKSVLAAETEGASMEKEILGLGKRS